MPSSRYKRCLCLPNIPSEQMLANGMVCSIFENEDSQTWDMDDDCRSDLGNVGFRSEVILAATFRLIIQQGEFENPGVNPRSLWNSLINKRLLVPLAKEEQLAIVSHTDPQGLPIWTVYEHQETGGVDTRLRKYACPELAVPTQNSIAQEITPTSSLILRADSKFGSRKMVTR